MNGIARWLCRHAGWVLLLSTALSGVSAYYSALLYQNLRPDIEELLPTNARSVVDFQEIASRLVSTDNIALLIFSKDVVASRRFVDDLAGKLQKLPPDVVSSVEYKIDREIDFFKNRQILYVDLSHLKDILGYVERRIDYEKELRNPLNILRTTEIPEPQLDWRGLARKYDFSDSVYFKFKNGYYASADQEIRVILINLPGDHAGIETAKKMRASIDRAIAELNPASYSKDLEIRFTGGVQNLIEEHTALVEDLELTTIIVVVLTLLAMLFYFRTFWGTSVLILSLFMGTFWTFAIAYFVVGYLNANSAFLGGIVIGNGINFGIILLARYLEERRGGLEHEPAVSRAMSQTFKSTLTAALAAGLAYGSLSLTSFRGFRQFGVIGLIGMVLCWISAYTVFPALLTLTERFRLTRIRKFDEPKRFVSEAMAAIVRRAPGAVLVASLLASIVSVWAISRYQGEIIESDLSKLRNKTSLESGSAYYIKHLDEIFQRYLAPMVVLAKSREDAQLIASKLRKLQSDPETRGLISAVRTIDDFVPSDQQRKIEVLRQIRKLLPEHVVEQLEPEDKKLVRTYLNPIAFHSLSMKDLPELILGKFTERDGSAGKLILVEPPFESKTWPTETMLKFANVLRETADSVSPGTPVTGQLLVISDMMESIRNDGPQATVFAFLAVIILVTVLFRNLKVVILCLSALLLGVLWLAGVIFGDELKINFLNFVALPITFGIGVDYAVNIFQRYRLEGRGKVLEVVRNTGGAVGLASLTTIIGYGALLIAQNQAFVSFGQLAVLGEITCFIGAVLTLPAGLYYLDRKKALGLEPKQDSRAPVGTDPASPQAQQSQPSAQAHP